MVLNANQRAKIVKSIKKLVLAHHINVAESITEFGWRRLTLERRSSSEIAAFEGGVESF